ncbi:MAG: beta-ketoacyl synthase, partial [Rivularia sp. (in: cyanobacteria)]
DGAKIFIETGAGSVCSRWIDKNLSDKEHMTISLNRRGVDDHSSIIKALAKLVSHQVDLDLSPLYSTVEETSKAGKLSHKKIILGGYSFSESILTAENKKFFQNQVEVNQEPLEKIDYVEKTQPTFPSVEIDLPDKITPKSQPAKPEVNPIKKVAVPTIENQTKIPKTPANITSYASTVTEKLASTVSLSSNRQFQYKKVNANNLMVHKTHSTFLQSRQEFSQQLSEIIELQITCAEQLFNS